jgi:hypothetical protein
MESPANQLSLSRVASAILIGLSGAVFIWWVTPYNNFLYNNGYIADSHLPAAPIFLVLILVLIVNPLLRKVRPKSALTATQLGIIFGVFLIACIPPGQGLLRQLPYTLAKVSVDTSRGKRLVDAYEKASPPESLFLGKLEYRNQVPAAEHFIDKLPEGVDIPWSAWIPPLFSWGVLLLFAWIMMMALAAILYPQWKNNERLSFPLLTIQESLIEEPARDRFLAPVFRSRGFWVAAISVFAIFLLYGGNRYLPERVPPFPVQWNVAGMFTEGFMAYIPGFVKKGHLYFLYITIAFFMPSRVGFSLWFFVLAFGIYEALIKAYSPPFHADTLQDHREGAAVALTVAILWLGRSQWARVLHAILHGGDEEAQKNRILGIAFLIGMVGIWGWFIWIGVSWLWSLAFTVGVFMLALLASRIVAETGFPYVALENPKTTLPLIKIIPDAWIKHITLFGFGVQTLIFWIGTRIHPTAITMHILGLQKQVKARFVLRYLPLLLLVLMTGVVVSGAVHLYMNYHHSITADEKYSPVNSWGTARLNNTHRDMNNLDDANLLRPAYNQLWHFSVGAGIAGFLQWACLVMPKFPFHPIGYLMGSTWHMEGAWLSLMIGWLLKHFILRYGGSDLFTRAKPVFIGFIVGEVFAAAFWCLLTYYLVRQGVPPAVDFQIFHS